MFYKALPRRASGGGGVFNHKYRTNDFAVFARTTGSSPNLTVNLGLRVEEFGAFRDEACHIGISIRIWPRRAVSIHLRQLRFKIHLGGSPVRHNSTYKNDYTTGWGPRIGLAYDLFGHHTNTFAAATASTMSAKTSATADQPSFQGPFLPSPLAVASRDAWLPSSLHSLANCPNPNPTLCPLPAPSIPTSFLPRCAAEFYQ